MSALIQRSTRARMILASASAAALAMAWANTSQAAPYASGVTVSGTTVNFILNEDADSLTYSINGGSPVALTPTKGAQSFTLGSPTDTFSISAGKQSATGFGIPTGGIVSGGGNKLNEPSLASGYDVLSSDANLLNSYNSPRGVNVSRDPNAPNFGTTYISNSAAGTTGTARTLGDGIYAVRADQTDAFGYGDTAQDPSNRFDSVSASANSPFRVTVGPGGDVYVADFSDANSNVYRLTQDLTSSDQMLNDVGGPTALPPGRNHGSSTAVYVEGSLAGGNLTMYTLDEDLTSAYFGGPALPDDRNSLWKYEINGGPVSSGVLPTKVNAGAVLQPLATSDLDRGADGKWYLQNTRNGVTNSPSLFVLSSDGQTVLFNSLSVTRGLHNDPAFNRDILQYTNGMAVSPDQKWLALMLNIGDVCVIPLINGIPDLANRMVVDTPTDVISGRDIAFDAAGNIHYVSSGQQLYRVLGQGGTSFNTTSWNGTTYSFNQSGGLYWDQNGTAAGAGGATPSGTWDGSTVSFNANPSGSDPSVLTAATTDADNVIFTAGADGTGSYSVTVSGEQHAHAVNIARGNVTFNGGILYTPQYDVATGATATVNSDVVGGPLQSVTKTGGGTLKINSNSAYTGGTKVFGGTLEVNKMHADNPVTISGAGATLKVADSAPTFPSHPVGNDAQVSEPSKLTITNGGTLDLGNNDMIIRYGTGTPYGGTSPAAAIEALIAQGYNAGDWLGTGITSSAAASVDAAGNFALGIVDNATLPQPFGVSNGGDNFSGVDVPVESVLVKFTHRADINLDGLVTDADAILFSTNYEVGAPATWSIGDLDYDGVFTDNDTIIFGTYYDIGLAHLPEPASLGVLGMAAAGLLARRRKI